MTHAMHTTHKTPLARFLFENDLSLREAAPLFKTNRTTLAALSRGEKVPKGETREILSRVLIGELTLSDLKAQVCDG
ncbi:hypothetical protein [Asticcacaulis excentricus]|uniref:hypothetical protein n=1 Tax=Asticcacaulis excentricus TaxID=78587 RepID=UPI000F8181A2|nr:hypothetical protein [Asticcacaulis excentricus]